MDEPEIREAISRCCPQWRVDSIRYLDEGDFCRAYLVNGDWVLRLAKHEAARQSLGRELCLLPVLKGHLTLPIPSPQIVGLDGNGELLFVAHPLLPGPCLSRQRYARLGEPDRARCTRQVANFLSQLHCQGLSAAHDCGVPVRDYAADYSSLLSQARNQLYPALEEPERLFVERVISTYLEAGEARAFPPTLLHGDLSPDHVLFDEASESVSAVIDFGDMAIGDPAWDLVFLYEDYGLDFLSRVLRSYGRGSRTQLVRRLYQHYQIAAIDWAVGAHGDRHHREAVAQLGDLRAQEEHQRQELFAVCEVG